jgi:lysophospholipase L1-like esterase
MPLRLRLAACLAAAGLACAAAVVPPAPPGVERVVFVGDSLVSRSNQDHGLLGLVRRSLERTHPGQALDLVDAGVSGNCIKDIRARLVADVLSLRPAAVVLYWDSDAADVEDADESPARSRSLRAAYESELDLVLTTLRETTPHVIVSGPTLLGERPRGRNPKDAVLDAYARINRRLCHVHDVSWVNTRHAAFGWLGQHAAGPERDSGRLTEDGEHLNQAGTELVAEEMAAALGRWLGGRPTTPGTLVEPPALPAPR